MLELLAAIAKFVLYAGSFAAAGVAFASASLGKRLGAAGRARPGLVAAAAAAMLMATLASAAILVVRLGGQLDATTLSAIWEAPVGPALVLQFAGAALLLAFSGATGAATLLLLGAGVCALAAFGVNGHSPAVDTLTGAVAFFHVAAASWWLGSLLLLREAGQVLSEAELAPLVRRFSTFAIAIVLALVVCGGVLVLALVRFDRDEWLTPYAQALVMKILLVTFVLGIAVYNKLLITPRLAKADGAGARALNNTIGIELGLFGAVLLATAWLTTFNSPHT